MMMIKQSGLASWLQLDFYLVRYDVRVNGIVFGELGNIVQRRQWGFWFLTS